MTAETGGPEATILSVPKLFRLLDMTAELHEEVLSSPLDDAARARLRAALDTTVAEARDVLSGDLLAELGRLSTPLDATTTADELRVASGELLGWLEGVVVDLSLAIRRPETQPGADEGSPAGPI